ncbi:MAG: serine hydrolase [Pseudobdellovibrionaceae bacterium]
MTQTATLTLTGPYAATASQKGDTGFSYRKLSRWVNGATGFLAAFSIATHLPATDPDATAAEPAVASEAVTASGRDPNFIATPQNYVPQEFRLPQYGDPAIFVNFPACPNKPYMAYQADQEVVPASLTKVMTLYLVARAVHENVLQPDSQIRITQTAVDQARGLAFYKNGNGSMRMQVGDHYTLKILAQAAGASSEAVSTNALAIAYGRAYSWQGSDAEILTRFAGLMNATAHDLGMGHTTYANPTGNYGNRSTVRDTNTLFHAFQNQMGDEMRMMLGNRSIDTGRLAGVKPASSRALNGMTHINNEQINVRFAKTGALGGDYNEALTFIIDDGSRATISMIGVHGASGPNALNNRASAMRDIIEEVRGVDVQAFCHS